MAGGEGLGVQGFRVVGGLNGAEVSVECMTLFSSSTFELEGAPLPPMAVGQTDLAITKIQPNTATV